MLSGGTFRPDSQLALVRILAGYPGEGKFRFGTHYFIFVDAPPVTAMTRQRILPLGNLIVVPDAPVRADEVARREALLCMRKRVARLTGRWLARPPR
jgi:hypothetical protein